MRPVTGGKIIHQVFLNKKAADQLKDRGVSVSAELSAGLIGFSASTAASTTDKSSERLASESLGKKVVTYVVGGRPPKDPTDPSSIVLWSKTVEDYPMPVRIQPRRSLSWHTRLHFHVYGGIQTARLRGVRFSEVFIPFLQDVDSLRRRLTRRTVISDVEIHALRKPVVEPRGVVEPEGSVCRLPPGFLLDPSPSLVFTRFAASEEGGSAGGGFAERT